MLCLDFKTTEPTFSKPPNITISMSKLSIPDLFK